MSPQLVALGAFLRRHLFASICTALVLGCAVGAWFLWDDIDELEVARADRAKEGEAMLDLLVGGSTQRQELAAVREATHRIEDNLVIEANLADNNWYFYKFEEQTKARLLELHPQSSPTIDSTTLYCRIPYTLRVAGSFEQVAAFLLALETGPRLSNVTAFAFSRRDKESTGITLELTIELLGKK